MTEIATESLAARRARARTLRSATWQRCAGPVGASAVGVPGQGGAVGVGAAASVASTAGADAAAGVDGPAGTDGAAPVELVVLLPSTEAATVLLLCELAAELTG